MKKALVLLLALCMLLTLCACADSGEKEFEAAKALYDAGDYENAIEALQNVGHYAEITGMIADAQKQLAAESYGFLFTTWKDVLYDGTSTVTFHEDGTCDVDGLSMQYSMENDKVTVAGVLLDITQEDGIYHIIGENIDYVREEDYDQFNVEEPAEYTVELTLDNYLDYYEWVEEQRDGKDAYGNTCTLSIIHELTLKDAYKNRVNMELSEVEVGYTCERLECQGSNMQINFETLEYSGGHSSTEPESATGTYVFSPVFCADQYSLEESGFGLVSIYTAPEIVRVEGQLVIR